MTLYKAIYDKIFAEQRVSSYKIYEEYWYVVTWNKQTYIHYTYRQRHGKISIHWYFCSSILPPKWPVQTDELIVFTPQEKKPLP